MTKQIPKKSLEIEFKHCVKTVCDSLVEVCYQRVMSDPEVGLRYLSDLARVLDCRLEIELRTTTEEKVI